MARYAIARHYLGLVDVDGVLLTERQLQILSSAFPHLAAKLADRATGVAVFAGIRGKTVFSLRYANDRQEKQDEEISTHEILTESEL